MGSRSLTLNYCQSSEPVRRSAMCRTLPLLLIATLLFPLGCLALGSTRPPTRLQARAVSDSQIQLTWTDVSPNETSFELEIKEVGGGTWSEDVPANLGTRGTFMVGFLAPDTAYTFKLR